MNPPKYKIGDTVRRTDIIEHKTHTIEYVAWHQGGWIYSMERQGWGEGWAWVSESDIEVCKNVSY